MNDPIPAWFDVLLGILLVAGNLLGIPLWLWLGGGLLTLGRRLLGMLRWRPAAGQERGTGTSLRA